MRYRMPFMIGVIVGTLFSAAINVTADYFTWKVFVRKELQLMDRDAYFPTPASSGIRAASLGAAMMQANDLVAFKTLYARQAVVNGIDLRLFCENLLGFLVESGWISQADAVNIIAKSTEKSAGFKIEKEEPEGVD